MSNLLTQYAGIGTQRMENRNLSFFNFSFFWKKVCSLGSFKWKIPALPLSYSLSLWQCVLHTHYSSMIPGQGAAIFPGNLLEIES